jgi:signal transduction histidine kinase
MKPIQYYITVGIGAVCLILAIVGIWLSRSNQGLQNQLQDQQNEINRGNLTQQIGTNILRDMGSVALKNDKMKELLGKHGFNVTVNPSPAPQATPTSTP